ncbi:hypothetical protein D3C73_1166480 [compost metagenome]
MKAPPPRPDDCGSVKPSTAWIATAASTAEPPRASTFIPASTARGLAADTNGPLATDAWAAAALSTGTGAAPAWTCSAVVAHPASIRAAKAVPAARDEILRAGRRREKDKARTQALRHV